MSERERQPEKVPEKKEYSFEPGLQETVSRIEQLFATRPGVVVAITGSANDVGKTSFSFALRKALLERGIHTALASEIASLEDKPIFTFGHGTRDKYALILHAEKHPASYTLELEECRNGDAQTHKLNQYLVILRKFQKHGLPFSGINLRIFIYRPNKPFRREELDRGEPDILICNEKAVDKPKW